MNIAPRRRAEEVRPQPMKRASKHLSGFLSGLGIKQPIIQAIRADEQQSGKTGITA
jgi:hypothetical protein